MPDLDEDGPRRTVDGPLRTVGGPMRSERHRPTSASSLVNKAPAAPPAQTEADYQALMAQLRYTVGEELAPEAVITQPAAIVTPAVIAPTPAPPSVVVDPASDLVKFTVRIPYELRDRFRAMFHYTAAIDHDQSLGAIISALMENECRRREDEYNGGQPFLGGQVPLIRGRRPKPRD